MGVAVVFTVRDTRPYMTLLLLHCLSSFVKITPALVGTLYHYLNHFGGGGLALVRCAWSGVGVIQAGLVKAWICTGGGDL